METLRSVIRDALQEYLEKAQDVKDKDIADVTCDMADAVFQALDISEEQQDIEGAKVKVIGEVKKMGRNKREITITVEGGLIQDVHIPKGANIRVKVKDFDIEGSDADQVKRNKAGDEYIESVWEA